MKNLVKRTSEMAEVKKLHLVQANYKIAD